MDYAHVKATRTYERTLSDALEKRARAGTASERVPSAQDKFLDAACEKLKCYKNENTFENTTGYNAAGINSHSQFVQRNSQVLNEGNDGRQSANVKPKLERQSVGVPPSSNQKTYHSVLDRSEDPEFLNWMKEWQGRVALQNVRIWKFERLVSQTSLIKGLGLIRN